VPQEKKVQFDKIKRPIRSKKEGGGREKMFL